MRIKNQLDNTELATHTMRTCPPPQKAQTLLPHLPRPPFHSSPPIIMTSYTIKDVYAEMLTSFWERVNVSLLSAEFIAYFLVFKICYI